MKGRFYVENNRQKVGNLPSFYKSNPRHCEQWDVFNRETIKKKNHQNAVEKGWITF